MPKRQLGVFNFKSRMAKLTGEHQIVLPLSGFGMRYFHLTFLRNAIDSSERITFSSQAPEPGRSTPVYILNQGIDADR